MRVLIAISFCCFLHLVVLTKLGKPLVGLQYELYILYYGLGFIPICIHRLGHTRLWNLWYKQHVVHHHIRMYPSKKFDSPSPYKNTLPWKTNGNIINFIFPCLIACIMISSDLAKFLYLVASVGSILIRENYFHEQIHLTDSYWKDYVWFKHLKATHRIHHSGKMNSNYGFVDLFFDYCMRTLELENLGSKVEYIQKDVNSILI